MLEELQGDGADAKFGKVNLWEETELALKYSVTSVPTLVVISGGEVKGKKSGVSSKSEIETLIAEANQA